MRRWVARLSEWRRRAEVSGDTAAELQSHLDHLVDDHIRRGLAPADARREALKELGGLAQATALANDARGFRVVEALRHDARLAFRQLRKTPAFTVATALTLALGIGANTAIFSLVDAVMLRPLPYDEPGRIVSVWEELNTGLSGPGTTAQAVEPRRTAVAPANFMDYRARVHAFEALAAYSAGGMNLSGDGTPERLLAEQVTASYFTTLGVMPVVGRPFRDSEQAAGSDHVVILSHGIWQRRFGGDPAMVGRVIRLNGRPYEVVGVMPHGFVAPSAAGIPDEVSAWVPIVFEPQILSNRQEHIVSVVGRLRPGVTIEAARAELAAVSDQIGRDFPDARSTRASLELLRRDQITVVETMLMVLLGAVGLVLLLACVNVGSLLMVRALGRQREIAVRYALGASRGRVLFEQMVQSAVLAAIGGLAGLALGAWLIHALVAVAPATIPHIGTAALDIRVIGISTLIVCATAVLFGLWPAWQAAGVDPIDTLRAHDRPAAGSSILARRGGLLVAEVAIATVVLVGAVLMIRSLVRLNAVDLGFEPRHVLAASVALPPARYPTPERRLQFFENLEARLRAIPGVEHVAFGNRLPLRGDWISGMVLESEGGGLPAEPAMVEAGFQAVNPDYFATVGIALRQGRALLAGDVASSEPVAVVNETFARTLLGGSAPIGRRVRRGPDMPSIRIVGVVNDIRRTGRAGDDGKTTAEVIPQVYLAAAQTNLYPLHLRDIALKIRPAAEASVRAALPSAVFGVDPEQPVTAVRSLEETLAIGSAQKVFQTSLFAVFATVAVSLALVGIYGVVAYGVAQRRAEIAVRLALGATPRNVVLDVVGRAARLVGTGAALGLTAAYLAAGAVSNLLFELPAREAVTYLAVGIFLVAAGATAAAIAAARAARIDPMLSLK